MATIDYPPSLPDFRLGKQRQQVQTYRTSQPFNGPLFIEKITDESPVVWDVTVTCKTQAQARGFQAFLRQVKNGTPFNKDILIEEGFSTHEVRFIEEPLTPRQLSPHVWVYTGVIYAVKLVSNDALVDDDLIILYAGQAGIIDTAVNIFWPAKPDDIVNPFARLANPLVHLFTNDKTVEKLTNGTLTTDRATTGTQVSRTTGLVETVAIDTIREEAEGYLIEGASTNLLLRSEEFDNAAWINSLMTVTPNSVISPDGTLTADTVNNVSGGFNNHLRQSVSLTPLSTNSYSIFAKASSASDGNSIIRIRTILSGVVSRDDSSKFNLTTGVFTLQDASHFNFKSEQLVNGWWRISLSITDVDSNTSQQFRVGTDGVTANETIYIWGAQLEDGLPFASSYIKTTTTAVTRAADDVSFLLAGNVPTLPEVSFLYTFDKVGDNGNNNQFSFSSGGVGANDTFGNINNTVVVDFTDVNLNSGVTVADGLETKVAATFKTLDSNLYIDSALKDTDTGAITTALTGSKMQIGSNTSNTNNAFFHISDYMIYDFELTPTEVDLIQG